MTVSLYALGALVRCSGAFTTAAGAAQDPGTVTFKSRDPSGNVTTLVYGVDSAVVKGSTGNYYVDVDADEAGIWYFRFAGTVSGQAAGEGQFRVDSSRVD
jgi:hypothetical protein